MMIGHKVKTKKKKASKPIISFSQEKKRGTGGEWRFTYSFTVTARGAFWTLVS